MEKTRRKTKNKADLVEEIESLRRRVSRQEKTESEHKDLAERLSAQNMLLESITDSPSAISIVSTDLEGNVLFWN
ncbi:MAG: hypothetical protein HY580_08335, partial [Nitrospinae bacterium]|nr:hypothetical protein [Nitrospinota bacterium]